MKKQVSNWLTIPIVLIASAVLIGMSVKIGYDEGYGTGTSLGYNKGYQQGYNEGYQEGWSKSYYQTYPQVWEVGYDKGKLDGEAPYKSSTNATISLDKALAILELGKQNHLDWATKPDLIVRQDGNTGDTAFNLMWVRDYTDLENLLKSLVK